MASATKSAGADKRGTYAKMSKTARMQQQMMARTSYNTSIVSRSPAAMIASPYARSGEEKKFLDFSSDNASLVVPPVATAEFAILNAMITGAGFFNRIGNKVSMKSVHIKINIAPRIPVDAPGGNNQTCRWLLVYDRQTNGAFPTISTLLADYKADGTNSTVVLSGMNPTQTGRFIILREHFVKFFNINNDADLTAQAQSMMEQDGQWFVNWFVKLKDLEAIYQADVANETEISNGGLYLVCLSDATTANQSVAEWTYKSRLRFVG